mmetsp:Transcript_35932/g.26691  ORF Transcript_35932/g.26691 Transcript_35932/m.26691 type:complete len:136 (+) Transcript_35932:193-600(+)
MTQMTNLSTIGVKFLFKTIKYVLKRVFSFRNISGPIKFFLKLLLGQEVFGRGKQSASFDNLDQIWNNLNPNEPPPPQSWLGRITKSLVLAVVGLVIHLLFFFVKRRKDQKLRKMQEEQEKERQRKMEEEWNLLQM